MTPKEKAKELVDRFYYSLPNNGSFTGINSIVSRYQESKQCALIAVDEIIEVESRNLISGDYNEIEYFEEVKNEIQKL